MIRWCLLALLFLVAPAHAQIKFCSLTNTPCWTTSARPSTPGPGTYGFNTTTSTFEFWDGTAWRTFQSSNNILIASVAGINAATSSGSEDTLATISIPAGSMGANGMIEVTSLWNYTNSGNNKTPRGYFGGQNCMAAGSFTTSATVQLFFNVFNLNSTSSNTCGAANGSIGSATSTATPALSINTANATTVTLTGQAAGGDTLRLKGYIVKIFPGS